MPTFCEERKVRFPIVENVPATSSTPATSAVAAAGALTRYSAAGVATPLITTLPEPTWQAATGARWPGRRRRRCSR